MPDKPITAAEIQKLLGCNEATARQLAEADDGTWAGDIWVEDAQGNLRPLHHGPNWKPKEA